MRNPFVFKHFTVQQDKASFPVSTDSVLLGCYADFAVSETLLDIGTGTGLLSLIAAVRSPKLRITAIEPDTHSFEQASENFRSYFPSEKLPDVKCCKLNEYTTVQAFDHIICNPPYFNRSLKNVDARKAAARHTDSLSFAELCSKSAELSHDETVFTLILPTQSVDIFLESAAISGWFMADVLRIHTNESSEASLQILTLKRKPEKTLVKHLFIRKAGKFTEEYKALTSKIYLDRAFEV